MFNTMMRNFLGTRGEGTEQQLWPPITTVSNRSTFN